MLLFTSKSDKGRTHPEEEGSESASGAADRAKPDRRELAEDGLPFAL